MLSKSISMSELPISKKNEYGEKDKNIGQNLIKQYCSEQIIYSDSDNKVKIERVFQEYSVSRNSTILKSWSHKYEGPLSSAKENCASSTELELKRDLITDENVKKPRRRFKWKPVISPLPSNFNLPPKEKEHRMSTLCLILLIMFIFAAFAVTCTLFLASKRRICEASIDINAVKFALESNIFGQNDAVNEIVSSLNSFCSNKNPGILQLAFVGGTGTGKTYAISILNQLFPWKANIQHFVFPLHSKLLSAKDVHANFHSCGNHLVILDGFVPNEAVIVSNFLQRLQFYSYQTNIRAIVIIVFSTEDQKLLLENHDKIEKQLERNKHEIHEAFENAGLDVGVINFQSLQREHVLKCIQKVMKLRGIMLSKANVDKVFSNLPLHAGCKGVESKVQLLFGSGSMPKEI